MIRFFGDDVVQILIWEQDTTRARYQKVYLYDQFAVVTEFDATVKFVEDLGALVWSDREEMVLVAKEEAHSQIREFVKKNGY